MNHKQMRIEPLKQECHWINFKMNTPGSSHMGGVWEQQMRSVHAVLFSVLSSNPMRLDEESLKCYYNKIFIFYFADVFLKNVKYRCKLRKITMNRVRLNFFYLDITLQKSQKLVCHCFVRKPRFRCILHQRCVL